jgi:predicted dehydrogenase
VSQATNAGGPAVFATLTDASAPVRVILVGAGVMGRNWLRVLTASPDVELVGLVDLDLELARGSLADAGLASVTVGASVTEVGAATGAQAVVDVTVPVAHHSVNTEALFGGLPVLCEKPIAPTVSQALSLVATAEASGQLLMTSQSRRYYEHLAAFRDRIGSLGAVGIVSTEFFKAPHFGGFRDEMAQPLLIDMAIHAFDAARYLLRSDPVSVYCESYNPSWSWYAGDAAAFASFEFAGGTRYNFNGSWCSGGLETSWNGSWRVSGSEGSASWDGETAPVVERVDRVAASTESRAERGPEEIAGALAEFIHALRTGTVPAGEVHSNLLSLAMVEAAVQSAESGRRVVIERVLEHAYEHAIANESRADVRSVLEGWGSGAAGLALSRG